MPQPSESPLTDDDDAEFTDALDHFIFSEQIPSISASSSSSSLYHLNNNNHSTVPNLPDSPESQSSPSAAGLRLRRTFLRSKESDRFADVNEYGYKLTKETNLNSLNHSAVSALTDDVSSDDDRSVTVDSVSSGTNSVITLAGLIITWTRLIVKIVIYCKTGLVKIVIYCKISLLRGFLTFMIWLTRTSYMFVTDPFAVMARAKCHVTGSVSRLLKFCLGSVKCVLYECIERKKSTWKLCVQVGWGLLCAAFVGLVLVGLLVFAFVVGVVVMKCVVEAPVVRIAQLNFDYTRGAPVAFVPVVSCYEPICLECDKEIGVYNGAPSRVILPDRKLQATVSLTLPESGYNRNLGNFQVRVDYLSINGKPLASSTQPCTMRFKSWPIRLLMTVFKLVPLITGYSSESQTVNIKFNGYTEREIPTSCVRVVLEPRAEFAKGGGGAPEVYTALLKLESQLPLLKRFLWSWKATMFVWTSIMIFKLAVVFMLLFCARWLRLRGTGSAQT